MKTPASALARCVAEGLSRPDKRLPPWLFYDHEGSRLFELITRLPEYGLTRAERSILLQHRDAMVEAASAEGRFRLRVAELGAGSATKSQLLLHSIVRRQGGCLYVPVDVSPAALEEARSRIAREEPGVDVRPLAMSHEQAFGELRRMGQRQLVLFLGSSIGNYDDDEAVALLRGLRASLHDGGLLLLGTDMRKPAGVMLPAYDDAQGVTAAFNKNVLARINRELGGRFELDRFRHVACWNEACARVEMHLESTSNQVVAIEGLGLTVRLRRGERIHTESSRKYLPEEVEWLLQGAGFVRERWYGAPGFLLHLARAKST